MAAKLRRLAKGTRATITASAIFTASTRTAVRAVDLTADGAQTIVLGIGGADTSNFDAVGHFFKTVLPQASGAVSDGFRGAVILEPGEQIWMDQTAATDVAYVLNGVIDLSLS